VQKLKYFAEPGPIDNTDFLCRHNFVQPCFWKNVDSLVLVCSTDTWLYLVKRFDIRRVKLAVDEEDENEEVSFYTISIIEYNKRFDFLLLLY